MNTIIKNMNNIKNNGIANVANILIMKYTKEGYKRLYPATLLTRSGIQAKLASL